MEAGPTRKDVTKQFSNIGFEYSAIARPEPPRYI